jgi:hypothetical protein
MNQLANLASDEDTFFSLIVAAAKYGKRKCSVLKATLGQVRSLKQ